MAMDFLGSNLEELMKEVGGKFSMQTTLQMADQIVILNKSQKIDSKDRVHAHAQLYSQRYKA